MCDELGLACFANAWNWFVDGYVPIVKYDLIINNMNRRNFHYYLGILYRREKRTSHLQYSGKLVKRFILQRMTQRSASSVDGICICCVTFWD
jgi:hypothetical protein